MPISRDVSELVSDSDGAGHRRVNRAVIRVRTGMSECVGIRPVMHDDPAVQRPAIGAGNGVHHVVGIGPPDGRALRYRYRSRLKRKIGNRYVRCRLITHARRV